MTTTGLAGQPMSEFGLGGWTRDSIYLGSQLLASVRPAVATTLTLENVVGTWWILGEDQVWRPCSIASEGGNNILITNEWNESTHGTFDEQARTITAGPEWGHLSNDVSANVNRLLWANGSIWARGINPIPDEYVYEYYHPDMLGSVRAATDHGGQVVDRFDYHPFGEGPTTSAGSGKQRFTGKERDAETLLDYFGARYARSTAGRFLTVDPISGRNGAAPEPQRWNKYSYCLNNPMRYIDDDGRWATPVHNAIIDRVFLGTLLPADTRILKQASAAIDRDQSSENAYKHGMSNGNPPYWVFRDEQRAAERDFRRFVDGNLNDAVRLQLSWRAGHPGDEGYSPEALWALGLGLHAITDSYSPWHSGFQPWDDSDLIGGAVHAASEFLRGPSYDLQIAQAEQAARLYWADFLRKLAEAEKAKKQ